jgi:hypothetical protein
MRRHQSPSKTYQICGSALEMLAQIPLLINMVEVAA